MRLVPLLSLASLTCARNPRVIFGNDDGLGSLQLHQLYTTLNLTEGTYFVSAPCDDKSGTDSRDTTDPEGDIRTTTQGECRFNITHGAPGKRYGHGIRKNGTEDPHLYWVNGYPATGIRLGIDKFSADAYAHLGPNLKPELAITGVNFGANGDSTVSISGTVGAARYASRRGIPAVAFSGSFGRHVGWNDSQLTGKNSDALAVAKTYANLATSLIKQVIKAAGCSGAFLPTGTFLNVNFPDASPSTGCDSQGKFKWVLAYTKLDNNTAAPDVRQGKCSRMPSEGEVLIKDNQKKCLISLSLGRSEDLGVASVEDYKTVLKRLEGWGDWACL